MLDKAVEVLTGKLSLEDAKAQSKKEAQARKAEKEAKQNKTKDAAAETSDAPAQTQRTDK